ncbi:sensor domain-containing diguanylate cyclase [Patescibacteria group bacterium]|nr:sensor domain-containing diguanylate cyclase [Patescibacteria group bacterium]
MKEKLLKKILSLRKFKIIFDSTSDGIFLMDLQNKSFFLANNSCLKMTGYSLKEFNRLGMAKLFTEKELPFICQQLEKFEKGQEGKRSDVRFRRKDGSIFLADVSPSKIMLGRKNYVLCAFKDITERKGQEDEIRRLAYYDSLTGLPNRRLFFDRLEQVLIRARRNDRKMAVIMIDLDHLKRVNDDLGHEAGDVLIKETGSRIAEALRAEDTVARLGGDEFAVIVVEMNYPEDAEIVAKKIIENVNQPLKISEEVTIRPVISVGVAIFPDHGPDGDTLVKNADATMYAVKRKRTGSYQIYSEN